MLTFSRLLALAASPAVDKDVLRINVERSEEKKEEQEGQGLKWHR